MTNVAQGHNYTEKPTEAIFLPKLAPDLTNDKLLLVTEWPAVEN